MISQSLQFYFNKTPTEMYQGNYSFHQKVSVIATKTVVL